MAKAPENRAVLIAPCSAQVSELLLAICRAKASIRSQALRILTASRRSTAAARISAASVPRAMTRPAAASIATRQRKNSVTQPVGDVADRGAGKADQNHRRVAKSGDGDQRDAKRE